ncbi:ATP-binding domain-containing protein [Rossellomorea aquimaris]|uniref:HelD family protein n=1 Tax=Rossellomorea aquimaris TaxID=189382 RepID=UPI001CD5A8EF|nr:3'-5' exonuclease [Rossellomorea aquimaris]MCA1054308.1 ATP-binding domain-containing protein [Rossellomorea aquimaris]
MDKNEVLKEQSQLDNVINKLEDQSYFIWELLDRKRGQLNTNSYKSGKSDQEQLSKTKSQPYFGRIDIHEDGTDETLYIGKQGVRDKDENLVVLDWRMPMASVYYNFMPGKPRQNYTVYDEIHRKKSINQVEVKLKREFTIKDKKIIKMLQQVAETNSELNTTLTDKGEELTVTDDFLKEILESGDTTGYLKEIIATIQKEQDEAIRQPLECNVMIQGVAGSGKSSIALHRLSYLLFNNKHLKAEDLLILGPSNLFISSFRGLLPELNLDGIRQSTFQNLIVEYLKPFLPHGVQKNYKVYFEEVLFRKEGTEEQVRTEFKGSESFVKILDKYVYEIQSGYERRFVALQISDERLLVSDLLKIFEGYAYLPFVKQVQKFIHHVETHFKDIVERKIKDIVSNMESFLKFLDDGGLSGEEKELARKQVHKVGDYKVKKLNKELKVCLAEWKKSMEIPDPHRIYKQVLSRDVLNMFKKEIGEGIPALFEDYGFEEVTYFDIAPIFYIYLMLYDPPEKFAHIIIDEGQDLSFVHYAVLKKMTKTVTILGDKEQSIFRGYGQYNWNNLMKSIFNDKKYLLLSLDTSYRSTKEIITVANKVLENHYGDSYYPIIPLNRSGPEASFNMVTSGRDLLERLVTTIESWKLKYKRIAVIHKDEKKAIGLADYLSNHFNQDAVYVNPDQEVKQGYVSVLSSYYSKGMEFDAVIVVNANEESFPKDELHARLLYVLLTRAQQEVKVFYRDTPSPLLEGLVVERPRVVSEFDDIL